MGDVFSLIYFRGKLPDGLPKDGSPPTFDPQFGFDKPRIPREVKISEQEAKALRLTQKEYDYCAHLLVAYKLCFRRYYPFYIFCSKENEAHKHCEIEDYILRMKEFEREKRLRLREMKKKGLIES